MITQREAFEAHAQARFLLLDRWATEPHEYHVRATNEAWIAWQAAQAAMPKPASRVPMTDAQLRELVPDWIGHHLVKHFELPELMRAVEAHHDIGAAA